MKKFILTVFTFCMFGFIAAAPAHAQQSTKPGMRDDAARAQTRQSTRSGMPDEATMQRMMELSEPGEKHELLDKLAGVWNFTVTHKMGPDAPEEPGSGISENRMVLGDRFVQYKMSGTMELGGETHDFEGIGFTGYDKIQDQYVSTWIDNLNTGLMTASGTYDPETETITESGQFSCALRERQVEFTSELEFIDDNNYTYTMYDTGPDGEEYKAMVIEYTRSRQRPS